MKNTEYPLNFYSLIEHVRLDYGLEKSGIQLAIFSRH